MSIRFATIVAAYFILWFNQLAQAIDPASANGNPRTFIARTDALSDKATLVSLTAAKLPTNTEYNEAGRLPEATVDAIREVYVWGWPLVYMSNLKQSLQLVGSPGRSGGAPVAPINSLCMLTDVVTPEFQSVPCPNRDVVYGFGLMDLKDQPVIVQVPDFGDRFWLYQIGDHRMESIGQVGKMYGTQSGFIMVVGPDWQGQTPERVTQVIRSATNLTYIMPRVVISQAATNASNREQLQETLSQIVMYPLSKFNAEFKRKDWNQVRWYPAIGRSTRDRNRLVRPETFFDDLQKVLSEIEPTPAEQPLAELAQQLEQWSRVNAAESNLLRDLALQFERDTIGPMFDFSSSGKPLPGHWHTLQNGAAFGDDYWTRTAIAKSNPFVNREVEAKYYYLEQASNGQPLQGGQAYQLHFAAGELPPADGFWSLTLYNEHHQFHPNAAQRHSVGSVNGLKFNADGSLTILVQPKAPLDAQSGGDEQMNWLPSPSEGRFKLYLRLYQPQASALDGSWVPAPCSPNQ